MRTGKAGHLATQRALLTAWITIDFFGANRKRGEKGSGSLSTTIFRQGFLSFIFAAMSYQGISELRYLAGTLGFTAMFAVLTTLDVFAERNEEAPERDLLGTCPISSLQLQLARAVHLSLFLLIISFGLAIAPGILACWVTGSVWSLPLYLLLSLLVSTCMCGLVQIPILLVARLRGRARASGVAALVRSLCIGSAFFGLALGYRAMVSGPGEFPGGMAVLQSLPPYWFARAFQVLEGKASPDIFFVLASACPFVVLGLYVLVASLPQRRPSEHSRKRGGQTILVAIGKLFCKRAHELGMLQFILSLMARERSFRLLALPILCLPLGMMLFSDAQSGTLFFGLMHNLPTAYLPFLLAALPYSDNHKAAWLLDTAIEPPLLSSRRGAQIAFASLMIPVQVLLFFIDAWFRGALQALPSSLCALGLVWLVLPRLVTSISEPCFSQDPQNFRSAPELAAVMTVGLVIALIGIVLEALPGFVFFGIAPILLVTGFLVVKNHEPTGYAVESEG